MTRLPLCALDSTRDVFSHVLCPRFRVNLLFQPPRLRRTHTHTHIYIPTSVYVNVFVCINNLFYVYAYIYIFFFLVRCNPRPSVGLYSFTAEAADSIHGG